MPKEVFIATSYEHRNEDAKTLSVICETVLDSGFTPILFVDLEREGSPHSMMAEALDAINRSVIFIAEVSHKKIGIGVEAGYASAKDKKIIYLRKDTASVSKTILGISDEVVIYHSHSDLREKLGAILLKILSE